MKLSAYDLRHSESFQTFEFVSLGAQGNINKTIQFQTTSLPNVYNLAFGDMNNSTGTIDDTIVSNNGDSLKILATIAKSVYLFTSLYPEAWVFATGTTHSRNRLYRMGISAHLHYIIIDFEIFGELNDTWEPFSNNRDYSGFLVKKKIPQ